MSPVVKRERFVVELDNGERWQESMWLWAFSGNGRRLIPNPWRHAYVRAKHFRRAAEGIKAAGLNMDPGMIAALDASRAAENSAWGCDPSVHVKRPES